MTQVDFQSLRLKWGRSDHKGGDGERHCFGENREETQKLYDYQLMAVDTSTSGIICKIQLSS